MVFLPMLDIFQQRFVKPQPFITAMVVPTGIGASVGGFAGDATPAMNLLASVSDILITHPNVANAAIFQKLPDNALYVEGFGLDQFFQNRWGLCPVRSNRVGVLIDSGVEPGMRILHQNVIGAVQAVYGVEIAGVVETSEPIEITYGVGESGCAIGSLKNPDVLLEACQRLIEMGATAIALCVHFNGATTDTGNNTHSQAVPQHERDYQNAQGVDPVGAIEAILSHTVVSRFQIPCAHSPVFPESVAMPETIQRIHPKAAAEYIAPTFLPCVLQGLSKAPRFLPLVSNVDNLQAITVTNLSALVLPHDALGGIPALSCLAQNIPMIAVGENSSLCNISAEHFATSQTPIYSVSTYLEAAGLLQTMRLGLSTESLGKQALNHRQQSILPKPLSV